MLNAITGEIRVFTKEFEFEDKDKKKVKKVLFSGCVGYTKTDDNKYINYYMSINFSNELKKAVAKVYKQDSFDVLIKKSWIKAYKDKDDNTKPILFIQDATIVTNTTEKKKDDDGDLPF